MNQSTGASDRGGVIAGLFHSAGDGENALSDLKAAGFTRVEISQVESDSGAAPPATSPGPAGEAYDIMREGQSSAADAAVTATGSRPFFHEHDSAASSFVDELTSLGFSKHDSHDLVDGLISGAAVVTADAGAYLERAVAILKQHRADIRYAAAPDVAVASPAPSSAVPVSNATDADREIQLRAERLVINKQRVQHGEARVRKVVVTEMKSFDVPVSHEELVIERHAVTNAGVVDSEPIAETTVRIPLTEEKVTISKETLVKEEVEVGTRRVEGVEHVSETVRHEELRVEDPTTPPSTAPQSR